MTRSSHDSRRLTTIAPLPPWSVTLGWLLLALLIWLLALSSSANALAANPVASLPHTGLTSTATDTTPAVSASQAVSPSADPAPAIEATKGAGESVERTANGSTETVGAREGAVETAKATVDAAGAGVGATVERVGSSVKDATPVKETTTATLTTVGQAVGGKVATVAKGSTPVREAVIKATTAPVGSATSATSAIRAAATTTTRHATVATHSVAPTLPAPIQKRAAGAAPSGQEGSAPQAPTATSEGQLERWTAPPPPFSEPGLSVGRRPATALSPITSGAPRARVPDSPSPAVLALSTTTTGSTTTVSPYGRLTAERGAASTIYQRPSAAPASGPQLPLGATGYSGVAAAPSGAGLSTLLLIFGLLAVGGLTAMRLLRLASEPRRVAPIALIPERPG